MTPRQRIARPCGRAQHRHHAMSVKRYPKIRRGKVTLSSAWPCAMHFFCLERDSKAVTIRVHTSCTGPAHGAGRE
jgi:hypothetical protein